jgi:hypothetical protein
VYYPASYVLYTYLHIGVYDSHEIETHVLTRALS